MEKFLVMVSGKLEGMYSREHFVLEADSRDHAASKALLAHAQNDSVPPQGLHLVVHEGDDWSEYSARYPVVDEACPSELLASYVNDEAGADEALSDWVAAHELGALTIVGPLK